MARPDYGCSWRRSGRGPRADARAPGQPELAIGAVDESGTVLKGGYFDIASEESLREEVRTQPGILRSAQKGSSLRPRSRRHRRSRASKGEADEVVCLYTSEDFFAVGQFFNDFSEVTNDIVVAALARPEMAICAPTRVMAIGRVPRCYSSGAPDLVSSDASVEDHSRVAL